jgi:hypothetical protein
MDESLRRGAFGVPASTASKAAAWLLALVVWGLVRKLQIRFAGLGTGFDVSLYLHYAQEWGAGRAPYVDFSPEYPAGALPVFLLPLLTGGAAEYANAFAQEMAVFDLAAFACVLLWASRETPQSLLRVIAAGGVYLLSSAALFPVLYTRYDLVPGALTALAAYAFFARRSERWGGALLGLAGAVKLWPLALVPTFVGVAARRRGIRGAITAALGIGAGTLLPFLLVLPRAGASVLSFLEYHAARGIQLESTCSSLALLLDFLRIAKAVPAHEYGAFHLQGTIPSLFAKISSPMLILLALLPQGLALTRDKSWSSGSLAKGGAVVTATSLGFMIGGKVLSPQYMLWVVALLSLRATTPLRALGLFCAAVLTTVVYPYLSPALEERAPGHGWALLALGTRNLLLVALYVATTLAAAGARARPPVPATEGALASPQPPC